MSRSERSAGGRPPVLAIVVVALALVVALAPLAWLAVLSLMNQSEVASGRLLPSTPNWANWAGALAGQVPTSVVNSIAASVAGAIVTLAIAAPAAWAIVRSATGGRLLAGSVLGPWLLPPIVAVVPMLVLLRSVGLTNTLVGLALLYGLINVPVAIWLLEGFARRIPVELDEAAQLDGASPWRTFRSVALPLLVPGLIAVGVLVGILGSQEFLLAAFITQSPDSQTAPVVLANLLGERIQDFGKIAAASLVAVVPIFVIATLLQRRLVAGLTAGALR